MEDLKERQENELLALKTIYSNNFVNLRETVNGTSKKKSNQTDINIPLFKITLFPVNTQSQHEIKQVFVQTDLMIKFSTQYPNEIPKINLENVKGLSSDQIRTLHRQLVKKAEELKGVEMIYELCQEVEDFLYKNNKPPSKSFYEQRMENCLERQKQEESSYNIEKTNIDHQLIAEIDQAVDLKKKMLQLERKKEKSLEKRERHSSTCSQSSNQAFQPFNIEFKDPIALKIKCIKLIKNETKNSLSVYRGIEINTNEIYDIYEWKLCLEKNKIFEKKKLELCQNEMQKIEEEFRNLSRLNNKLLVKYLALKYFKETDKNVFTAQFCFEYIEGNTAEMFVNKNQTCILSESTLRTIIKQLLDALDYLHSNHLVHRELTLSSVRIEKNSLNVRLSDFSIVKRMNNLNELVCNEAVNVMTGNIKADFHELGRLILSISQGEVIKEYYPVVPITLPPELRNFVNLCLNYSDKQNCKALKNHPFIIKATDSNLNKFNSPFIKRNSSLQYDDDEDAIGSFTDYSTHSRLNIEFDVIGIVGEGAYGKVLKVKNKLDLRYYAIKRIEINPNSKQINKLIAREIKLLSRLNHENVVRYYSTWVEQDNEKNFNRKANEGQFSTQDEMNDNISSFSDEDDDDDSDDDSKSECVGMGWTKKDTLSLNDSEFDFSSESENNEPPIYSSDESIAQNKLFRNDDVYFNLNTKDESDDIVIFADNSEEKIEKKKNKNETKKEISRRIRKYSSNKKNENIKCQYIYIQMEYCGRKTLKDLIDNGLYQNEEKIWCLFREILQGLNHIHEQGMIHRDLKPSNVLIGVSGHAKIGDFGLATSRFRSQREHITAPNNGQFDIALEDNMNGNSLTYGSNNGFDSLQSESLSGAVGTALYVAPELLIPLSKNKYIYTQKVDIYSLGIMFYEMCFYFSTSTERINVIKNLRVKDAKITSHNEEDDNKENQLNLIRMMLNHDPSVRPSAKDLLLNEMIPKKADEIALDELLKYSFQNKQSSYFKKIFKAIFDQKSSRIDDASFDAANCKPPHSIRFLQIREHIHNNLQKIFQKHGAYMITSPLLTPCTDFYDDYDKAFKLTDTSGLVLCLPYNHRIPFARYLARSGITNIKRYQIGNVFTEKLKLTSLHPREHIEASFDIVTTSVSDCLPEIEILSVMKDVISSFPEMSENNYVLIINHSYILNAILHYCGISDENQKNIYYLLADFNVKFFKYELKEKDESRENWFKDRLPHLKINENAIEKLLNYFLKNGEPEKVLSELRSLTKNETLSSKLAKEAINQMKQILSCIQLIDLKIPIILSPAFVLPIISHPFEYSGFIFQLQVARNIKKNEYEILASGGRYDNLIKKFRNKPMNPQGAVGISFDFEKIAFIVNENTKQNSFRSEIAVCSIGDSTQSTISQISSSNSLMNFPNVKKPVQKTENSIISSGTLMQLESKNRLRLYKQLMQLNKNFSISTHLIHEKFNTTEEMDEFCKQNFISSYTYINDNTICLNSKSFTNNENLNFNLIQNDKLSPTENSNNTNSSSNIFATPNNQSFLSIRSWVQRKCKFLEKKFSLNEFLAKSNAIINNMASYSSINSNSLQYQLIPFLNPPPVTNGTTQSNTNSNISSNQSYIDFVSFLLNNQNLNGACPISPAISNNTSTTNSLSSTSLNSMSQLNFTILLRQPIKAINRKRLELQTAAKLNSILSMFSYKTRIDVILIEIPDNVIQVLANYLHLEQNSTSFRSNWNNCIEKLNNEKNKRQLIEFNLETILYDLRYINNSKVFILYAYNSDQFKLIVAA